MVTKFKIGDRVKVINKTSGFIKGVVTEITGIKGNGLEEGVLYITKHSGIWGVLSKDIELLSPNWKKKLGVK